MAYHKHHLNQKCVRTLDILNRGEEEASPRYRRIFRCTLYDAPPSPVLQPEFLYFGFATNFFCTLFLQQTMFVFVFCHKLCLYFVFATNFVCILFLQQTLFVFCISKKLCLYFVSVPVRMIPEVEQANSGLIH